MEFIHGKGELIVGSIGSIKIWNFKRNPKKSRKSNDFNEIRLDIQLDSQEWVNVIHVCEQIHTVFVGCDNNLYVINSEILIKFRDMII